MRLRRIAASLALALLTTPAFAETSRFDMLIAGLKVGDVTLTYTDGYRIDATARSSGAARIVGSYDFAGRTTGSGRNGRLTPSTYSEAERRRGEDRSLALRLGRNPVVETAERDTLAPAKLRGAIDPLTALHLLLDRRDPASPCTLDLRFTDGVRLARLSLQPTTDPMRCAGRWERLDGPPPADGRETRRVVGFDIRLDPASGGTRVSELSADAPIGRFVIRRR